MTNIGGNTVMLLQTQTTNGRNSIGERVRRWEDVARLTGWLDLANGDTHHTTFSAAIQESTHIFLCDYRELPVDVKNTVLRMALGNDVYQVQAVDDPMGMHEHLEIYLKYTGGQHGG